ncbi:MAG: hypothetical protein CSB55_08870 [Candidatus Cloacimonadota bacterium]|nr:MAG: hypothetical protein CSB55_08870 [Candidatus Cloacimonadota bacterium]
MKNETTKELIKDLIGIIIGTFLCGFGFSLFLIPYKASPGGVGGISQIFYYLLNFPAGLSMLAINIPLFLLGIKNFGKMFGFKTVFAMISLTFFTDILSPDILLKFETIKPFLFKVSEQSYSFTSEIFLAVVAGSIIVGAGFGTVIKFNGSTGGTDIPALMLRKHFGISIGNAYLIIDTLVIFSIGIIFKDANLILWGLLSLFISSKVCDFIIEGYSLAKSVMIFCSNPELMQKRIKEEINRDSALVNGYGTLMQNSKNYVYVVLNRRELPNLKHTIKEVDADSVVTIHDIHEAIGKDFKKL